MDEMITETSDQVDSNVKSPIIVGIPDGALGDDEGEISPRCENIGEQEETTVDIEAQSVSRQTSGESESGCNGRKGKKGRRNRKGGKNHQWKPYNKLCWEERQKIDDRETKRACAKRQKRFESGHPVAPYNTTQFLMDDHDQNEHIEPDLLDREENHRQGSGSYESSGEDYYESPNDDDSFLVKDFSETYNNIHAERLQNMNKQELVKEFISMETQLESLEKQMKVLEENKINRNHLSDRTSENMENFEVDNDEKTVSSQRLQIEIEKLRSENKRLQLENEMLSKKMS